MQQVNIYPKELVQFIQKHKQYIPCKLSKDDRLKLYHRYVTSFNFKVYFKVQQIYMVNNIQYYSVQYSNNLLAELPHPLSENSVYDLIVDKNSIRDKDIINSGDSYYGYEIKYWFYNHNNNITKHFEKYILSTSRSIISDTKRYRVTANKRDNEYYDCRVIQNRENNKKRNK